MPGLEGFTLPKGKAAGGALDFGTYLSAAGSAVMPAYQIALGVALIIVGAGLVCVALIWGDQAQTDPPKSDDDAGELRTFVDSLRQTDETEANLRPRIDRLRNEESLK
jgi:hypothetical protein